MNFGFDADQEALRELGKKALANPADPWGELARAGLTGVMLPVELGGAGLGFIEQCLVFEQAGRAAAPAALVPALMTGAALARLGISHELDRVTVALHELGAATTLLRDGNGWRLDGVKVVVPALERATRVLVPARLVGGGVALALVPTDARGLTSSAGVMTDDSTVHRLSFEGVSLEDAALVAHDGAAALAWLTQRVTVGFAAYELGIAARQLELTAEHVLRRQQFGKPIGLFQAVGQRCADMHIDVESLRLATWEAAYLLEHDDSSNASTVDAAVATAAFWAADAGARVAVAAQHLHGGIGFDRGYPLYRYFLAAKRVELELGGATQQLAHLGRILATQACS
jgi:alkylation response protein AidB-like acyl-CoA dehydrogenase